MRAFHALPDTCHLDWMAFRTLMTVASPPPAGLKQVRERAVHVCESARWSPIHAPFPVGVGPVRPRDVCVKMTWDEETGASARSAAPHSAATPATSPPASPAPTLRPPPPDVELSAGGALSSPSHSWITFLNLKSRCSGARRRASQVPTCIEECVNARCNQSKQHTHSKLAQGVDD